MIVNNHRKHSSFALRHFIAGGCHTPDAAYCLLYAQLEQLEMDVAAGQASVLKTEAKEMELSKETGDPIQDLKNKAEMIEVQAAKKLFQKNYDGAQRELKELHNMLEQLKPHCKYWSEDIIEMEQAMQHDEWIGELKFRGENMLLSNTLGIPHDHLATMRQHPQFAQQILPHIAAVSEKIKASMQLGQPQMLLSAIAAPLAMDRFLPELKEVGADPQLNLDVKNEDQDSVPHIPV